MKKERTFRPPQVVLDSVSGNGSMSISKSPIPLSDLRVMHSLLKAENPVTKAQNWNSLGGSAGLMWSRRVLRQEGLLKASDEGDLFIPEVIDLQLGPIIIAGVTSEDLDTITQKFFDADIPAAFIPHNDGIAVLFTGDEDDHPALSKGLVEFPSVALEDITVVDDSQSRMTSLLKLVGTSVVGVSCEHIDDDIFPVDSDWVDSFLLKVSDRQPSARIVKIDESLGLVIGWAIICTVDDQPYFDKQDDHITDDGMLEASTEFMMESRVAKEMHTGGQIGDIVFAWPMTKDIAEAFDIETNQTGLMIAMKPYDDSVLEKFRDGTYKGFSIGGERLPEFTEEVD